MKEILLKAIPLTVLSVILILASSKTPASADGKARRLEGTWRTQGTVKNCQSGAVLGTFLGLDSFLPGNSALATGSVNPATVSTGYGVWDWVGGRSFTNTLEAFRFNTDGTFAGSQRITRSIELDASQDEFISTNTLEIINPAGTVVNTLCSVETGTRIE